MTKTPQDIISSQGLQGTWDSHGWIVSPTVQLWPVLTICKISIIVPNFYIAILVETQNMLRMYINIYMYNVYTHDRNTLLDVSCSSYLLSLMMASMDPALNCVFCIILPSLTEESILLSYLSTYIKKRKMEQNMYVS